jgi:hypothetical protein
LIGKVYLYRQTEAYREQIQKSEDTLKLGIRTEDFAAIAATKKAPPCPIEYLEMHTLLGMNMTKPGNASILSGFLRTGPVRFAELRRTPLVV